MEEEGTCITPVRSELVNELREAGADVTACYQCGRCSAGCPLTEFFDLAPMQIVRMCCYGLEEALLGCRAIWICASCETCTTRCPNGIDIAGMMDVLRGRCLATRKTVPESAVTAFHKSFLGSIRTHGRVYELGMIAGYKLRTGDFFSDVGLGLRMLRRGKLSFLPARIRGTKDVRGLFSRKRP